MISVYLAGGVCFLLFVFALILPVGTPILHGAVQFEISPTLILLGRQFIIDSQDMPLVGFIYFIGLLWYLSAVILYPYRSFSSIGLGILSLCIAALSVEPFLYAALLIEAAVLVSVPMLILPGQAASKGVVRFIVNQTLALPFILLAGWVAGGVEANPADQILLNQAIILLGLGFAFLLAVFPFYFWIPQLCSEIHPFLMGFIFSLLPTIVLLLISKFLNTYVWLREYGLISQVFRFTGLIMVISAGLFSAFQRDLKRLFGYAVVMENGFSLLALSLGIRAGMEILIVSFLVRLMCYWIWATAVTVMSEGSHPVTLDNLKGMIQHYPFAVSGVIIAYFSLAGLPLLPGFPLRLTLLVKLSTYSLVSCLGILIGMLGFLLSGFRLMAISVRPDNPIWIVGENWRQIMLLLGGILLLILTGIFPNLMASGTLNMLDAFEHLI